MQLLRGVILFAVSVVAVFGAPEAALAKQHRFVGGHPVAKHKGGGFCYIEAPHVHVYAAQQPRVLYRDYDGWQYFAGDPVAHGYDGEHHAYHGAHPIHVEVAVADPDYESKDHHVEFCYLAGPHFHNYTPFADAKFKPKAKVNWYVGDFPPAFVELRPRYMRINAVYKPIAYERPVVDVEPPEGYVDVLVVVPSPAVDVVVVPGPAVDVVVEPPRVGLDVEVDIPMPGIELRLGPGGPRGSGHRREFRKRGGGHNKRGKNGHGHGHGHGRGLRLGF